MTFTDADYVADTLDSVLAALADVLNDAGRPVERVVKFPGMPAWDCEQLVVWPRTRIAVIGTTTSSDILRCSFTQILDINILLNRCITAVDEKTGGIPSAALVDADGTSYATDMWLLQRAITVGAKDGTLFGDTPCQSVRPNPIAPSLPQGGYSGMTTTIEVTL